MARTLRSKRLRALLWYAADGVCVGCGKKLPPGWHADHIIRRDRPDIAERLDAGEFPSVRAAALEAGIVQPSFKCPADPIKASRRLLRHFKGERLATLLSELANHAGYELTPKE